LIGEYEREEWEATIAKLIPSDWNGEMKMFTDPEFKSLVTINGQTEEKTSDEITKSFNQDLYNPVDGAIVQAVDSLSGFIEACLTLDNGIRNPALEQTKQKLIDKHKDASIAGIDFGQIYKDFL